MRGRKLLEQAAKLEPDLVEANEGLAMMHIEDQQPDQSAPYLDKAVRQNSKSFLTYFYHANVMLQSGPSDESTINAAEADYKKCVALNPNFAPAYMQLAQIYGRNDGTLDQALQAARMAVALDPADWSSQLVLAVTLARRGQFGDARALADRVAASATEPTEADAALSALTYIGSLEQRQANIQRYNQQLQGAATAPATPTAPARDTVLARRPGATEGAQSPAAGEGATGAAAVPATPAAARTYSMIGNVSNLDCGSAPQVTLTLSLGGVDMKLHAADISKVDFLGPAGAPVRAMACSQLRGITARMQYTLISGGAYDGEIRTVTLTPLPQ
jgi:Tfp pilus assembly protein PilF